MDKSYDVIIVGTGAAGLFAALCLPRDISILMVTKDRIENSDSYLAQGGISMLRDKEDYDTYFEDTMRAGRYQNRVASVDEMIRSSQDIIQDLVGCGVLFDRDEQGNFSYTREGGHTIFRILHHQDVTGMEITSKLITCVKRCRHIQIEEDTAMIDLIAANENCAGIITETKLGVRAAQYAKETILATGGVGGLFEHSTNFRHISGDSFAIALRHHIALEHIEYIQIHPTTLYSKKEGRRFLISESVRGEGALLRNEEGNRFVDELQPRDVVTAAIKKEMEKYHKDYVYLDMTQMPVTELKNHFPNIYERCLQEGYDISTQMLPVTPAQHYLMGGIHTDTHGQTSMGHLYAVGETACNGVHGANRLASNSLLESLVFAKCAAKSICLELPEVSISTAKVSLERYDTTEVRKKQDQELVLQEIKRRDGDFYDKWCKCKR